MTHENIPANINKWRQHLNITQAEAAVRLGVSIRTLQKWEQGGRTPRGLALAALMDRIKLP